MWSSMSMEQQKSQGRTIYQVIDLNQSVRHILESNFNKVWVEGEASNVKVPASGHVYFTLKDDHAQIRCVCFRQTASQLDHAIEDGTQLLVHARVSVYEARGDYQLMVLDAQLAGAGALQRAFLALKEKLQKLGWFDMERKRSLPSMPSCVGVVTSTTGAAIRDVLRVLNRRFPAIRVIIYPSLVQGAKAAEQLLSAVRHANERAECDVLLLVRGGGSLEDLWAFNDEALAEAIVHSDMPVVTGIGHQVDFSIADFVADWRAATPSAAAECVSPEQHELWSEFSMLANRLQQLTISHLRKMQLGLEHLSKRLVHPGERIHAYQMLAAQLHERLEHATQLRLQILTRRILTLTSRLSAIHLTSLVEQFQQRLQRLLWQLQHVLKVNVQQKQQRCAQLTKALALLNPLSILTRGYALVQCGEQVITDASQLKPGDVLRIRLAKGEVEVEVR